MNFAEGSVGPITGAKEDGDDVGFVLIMAFDCALHLDAVAVVGFDEVGTNEEKNDGGGVEVSFDLLLPILARYDHSVIPACD